MGSMGTMGPLTMNSRTAAHFKTLSSLVWPLFLAWSVLGLVVLPLHSWSLSQEAIRQHVGNEGLRAALLLLFTRYDAIWIFLAAVCSYAHTAATEGLAPARRWAVLTLSVTALLCGVNAVFGQPLGPLSYTEILGNRLAHLFPLAVPLLWLTIFLCARASILALFPRANQWPRWQVALGTATLVTLTDLNLETYAWKLRAWWMWYPGRAESPAFPPVQNFAVWFLVAFACAAAFRPSTRPVVFSGNRWKPVVILALLNLAALAFHATRW